MNGIRESVKDMQIYKECENRGITIKNEGKISKFVCGKISTCIHFVYLNIHVQHDSEEM